MPLRKRLKQSAVDVPAAKAEQKRSKRQRLADFFRSRKQKKPEDKDAASIPVPADKDAARKPARDSKITESTKPRKSSASAEVSSPRTDKAEQPPALEAKEEHKEEPKVEPLSEEHIHALFSGAPHFWIKNTESHAFPRATFPWNEELAVKDVSDSVQLAQPAFSAATLRQHLPDQQRPSEEEKKYTGYDVDIVEVPSMLSAQGLEPGTIGFVHFLELPQSDNLITDLQQSQSSNGFLEAVRNKEQMQSKPERLGIRAVDMSMVHDRLVELGDLFEAFQDSPERMTILNNQSSGDLYANLFGKFLTPPGYDSTADDPTGMKVQIDTLLKILGLKGVWHDFGLVEWRIRLGQILWSDSDLVPEHDTQPLWSERDILLLQILLACELLLRLDAVTSLDVDDVKSQMHVSPQDLEGFLKLKTRKTGWDLVLARRFLENILVVKEGDVNIPIPEQKSRGLLSMLSSSAPKGSSEADNKADIILLPQHQARQLAGLFHFAETVRWPGIDLLLKNLALKLGVPETSQEPVPLPSPHGRFLDPSTPSSISVYGTPLTTPRSNGLLDSYFGHIGKPPLSRNNSLQVPLSTTLLAHADGPDHALNVGGWLSRSYLTGLVLPGEAISHFLMSTLLENDKLAIAALGDSANLYGGFIYGGRTWWSKASVVARVLGCIEGAVECMGWVTFTTLPEALPDGWYAINNDQLQSEQPARIAAGGDMVARDSAVIPGHELTSVKPEDLALPSDPDTPPIPSVELSHWNLSPVNADSLEQDVNSTPGSEAESHVASITFTSLARGGSLALTLSKDVHFITSWPCTPPAASSTPNLPQILKRSQTQLSRSSSKRSTHSTRSASGRSSRHLSRRNSHGYEPLLSHPPDSPAIGPTRVWSPIPDEEPGTSSTPKSEPMNAHPLHVSYKYKIVPATEVLDQNFILPFTMHGYMSPSLSSQNSPKEEKEEGDAKDDNKTVLVLDARSSKDLELLARAWCAEKGLHALVGRVGRTCLACCIREARGIGVNVLIRV
ncbi:hypothetical protein BU26DRAFT_514075 [Trematosphaeria pertusa]|uniref:Uncharacterized protein n=1 Tax=Trematosphaeria pertusa TaxID=390896 RepID=A0A6A6J3I1_9PLEO|nr:uncharacterized protein BU26DRAFT_514075 [Trematosphaeria pertusa]KAF2257385.1 hypothetical protein BU26DRAFT_514075 [Trematosphaeria pertusa]